MILSKDINKNILNDNTKLIVKEIFGDDFANIVNNYEENLLEKQNLIE